MLKRIAGTLVIVGTLALVVAACAWQFAMPTSRRFAVDEGRLEISPAEVHVQATKASAAPHKLQLTLKNVGDKSLRILGVQTKCGCTVAQPLQKETLGPGESIDLRIDAHPPDIGEKRTSVEVYTDSKQQPVVRAVIILGGWIAPPYVVAAPEWLHVRGSEVNALVKEFEIRTVEHKNTDYWLKVPQSDSAELQLDRLTVRDEDGPTNETVSRIYRYRLSATAAPASKAFHSLVVHSAELPRKTKKISVLVETVPAVTAIPKTIFATVSQEDLPRTFDVRFALEDPEFPLSVAIDGEQPSWLRLGQANPPRSSGPFALVMPLTIVSIPEEGQTAKHVVQITTNHPLCRGLELPVYVRAVE